MDSLGHVLEAVSSYFALLSEPMRLRILHAICSEEKTVSQIVTETGATQTNVSRHLNTMYRAGALNRRKVGNFIYYGVRDSALTEICRTVCTHIAARGDAHARERSEMTLFANRPGVPAEAPKVHSVSPRAVVQRGRRSAGGGSKR